MFIVMILALMGAVVYVDYKIEKMQKRLNSLGLGLHDRVRDLERTEWKR